jgi:hypothetical protein
VRCQLEHSSADQIRDAALPRHRREVGKSVADHELGGRACGDECRDRRRRVLTIGVDQDERVGPRSTLERCPDARTESSTLPAPLAMSD